MVFSLLKSIPTVGLPLILGSVAVKAAAKAGEAATDEGLLPKIGSIFDGPLLPQVNDDPAKNFKIIAGSAVVVVGALAALAYIRRK